MTPEVRGVFLGLLAVLMLASGAGYWLKRRSPHAAAVANFQARVRAWWVMILVGGGALLLGRYGLVALFACLSWFALAEFVSKSWIFVLIPIQYAAVALEWHWCMALLIPALCLVVSRWEQRMGLLLCVYGLSWAPALARGEWVLYFVLVVQASDVLQYLWGKALGRHAIAPRLSPSKTVEGLAGGITSATALGALLHYLTPFSGGQAALVALAITAAGFASGLVFSAVKRRRGIKDWGTAIAGHGGVLDRVDSLCLSAPVFYLATWLMQFALVHTRD